ncbi:MULTISPECIES: cohesin domain-containing protein [Pseudoalteromonas]|uniref:Cohesin domain-containing protein n=1 Tax=Pseudoalteromonas luteoviolacea (strain 2ta16) TaxID=1353533 RepID=V4I2B4_PSEL2|nr:MULTISPECIES: cohesin domain-containing protein [Pseudoalteromonas]ESP94339.1 hypothetical protein PL2TA16_01040 [Pseudoalteromonas luteoviolacea 2ta16]KZN36119.1 hypothetical protein N483_22915 [Pseudoalteromonas luteoviolacea NCIMB 1944]MCG7549528.1 cohesin domain-containing protein [Pseudoalteromonas sp. Of7M-16]
MEKVIAIYLLLFVTAISARDDSIYISLPVDHIKTGSEFYVDIMADDIPAIYGVHLTLKYDPTKLIMLPPHNKETSPHLEHGNLFNHKALTEQINLANPNSGTISYTVSQSMPAKNIFSTNRIARVFFKSHVDATKTNIVIDTAYFVTKDGHKLHYPTQPSVELQFANSYAPPNSPTADFSLPRYLFLVVLAFLFGVITLLNHKSALRYHAD